jgi:hypothetical protein
LVMYKCFQIAFAFPGPSALPMLMGHFFLVYRACSVSRNLVHSDSLILYVVPSRIALIRPCLIQLQMACLVTL